MCVCVFSYVRRVADFGVFVRIHGTERTDALCHISECADAVLKELKKAFSEGDLVKGVILKTNPEKKQVYTPPPPQGGHTPANLPPPPPEQRTKKWNV